MSTSGDNKTEESIPEEDNGTDNPDDNNLNNENEYFISAADSESDDEIAHSEWSTALRTSGTNFTYNWKAELKLP